MNLDAVYSQEKLYYAFSSVCEETPSAWFLSCPDVPASREVNRAMRLRDDGRGAEPVVEEVRRWFRNRGLPVTADLDSAAEAQGIGFALRRRGITPVLQQRSLMRFGGGRLPEPGPQISVTEVDRGRNDEMLEQWIATNLAHIDEYEQSDMWREMARREASCPANRLYLGCWDGSPAGTCSLFCAEGMARIEMVETRREYRRRGVATAVIAQAVRDAAGAETVYLYVDAGSDAERLYGKLGFKREGIGVLNRHIES